MQSGNILGYHWGCAEYKMNKRSSNISNRGHSLDTALILRSVTQLTPRIRIKTLQLLYLRPELGVIWDYFLSFLVFSLSPLNWFSLRIVVVKLHC